MEPKFIFIDGTDRTGKGSLMQAIHKATNYKHIIFDRSVLSNKVYSQVYGRLTPELYAQYVALENQISQTNHIVLYLTCDIDTLEQRRIDTKHEEVDFEYHQELFADAIKTSPLKIYPIDTTVLSPDTIAKMLIDSKII